MTLMGRARGWTIALGLAALGCWVPPAAAQPPAPAAAAPAAPATTWFARNWTRVETWRFFDPQPGPGTGDPDYAFVANRLQVGVRHAAPAYELTGALQYVQFGHLPTDAFGPGALGTGGLYYDQSHDTASHQVYLKSLQLRLKPTRMVSVTLGRMPYTSGAETPSGVAPIEAVKRQRLDSRLLGEFEWSIYQRAYDGARLDVDSPGWHVTAGAFMPTQGGFEESANVTMTDVVVLAGVAGVKPARLGRHTELQAFTYWYDDEREVHARPDNLGLGAAAVPRVDVGITTFGASLVGVYPASGGEADVLVWVAKQAGDWFGVDHDASSYAVEAGYRWPRAPWQPWVRAGFDYASGDDEATDATHGTFFQVLPTVRKYSLSASYAQMNLRDLFAQVFLKPHAKVSARLDLHRLDLAQAADRWYGGSGATQSRGTFFGYSGRPSRGATALGTVVEGSADLTLTKQWSVNGYLGTMAGGEVVKRNFAGDRMVFFYVENVIQF